MSKRFSAFALLLAFLGCLPLAAQAHDSTDANADWFKTGNEPCCTRPLVFRGNLVGYGDVFKTRSASQTTIGPVAVSQRRQWKVIPPVIIKEGDTPITFQCCLLQEQRMELCFLYEGGSDELHGSASHLRLRDVAETPLRAVVQTNSKQSRLCVSDFWHAETIWRARRKAG